jgi:hypothetical protein
MGKERVIRRYAAYYSGWCVAFGEHDVDAAEERDVNWLFGERNVGVALAPNLKRRFERALLGRRDESPHVVLGRDFVRLNEDEYWVGEADAEAYERFRGFFDCRDEIHMFLTSHFCYSPGTRIVTFSKKSPLVIIYKEISPMRITLE